ncbi:hypothetical protein F5Y11DRAFT_25364 [Daldinia sp. FL1419]|nr:hypothetical protein F5Y11DRAFT_25364 [Daldinia sp. FL1419]
MAEPEVSDSNKQLSLLEKLKLLKISCKHGPRLLRCSTMGKHPEKDVWTSIMEEFSSTVRAGVFKKYTQVKTANNSMCRSRRRHTKGTIPPQRRSRMTNLDTWIDKWVRIWKCRDMIIRIANAHQGIRETIGEKKLKKIFRNRIDGTELPQELGVLTLSYPLWKAIQKRIRAVERSSKGRDFSICSDEDESYSTDDELDSDPMLDTGKDEPVLQSIETHIQPTISPAPEDSTKDLAPTQPDQRVLVTPESPSLPQRAGERLKELGKDFIDVLKASRGAKGKNVSVLELAQRSTSQQQVSSPQTSPHPQEAHIGNPPRPQSKSE